ncbi:nitroreductase family deazaflavin-dependent oxidoreductase [Nocardia sp. CDC159]|uniref:Nitroreductase family deazaflavin-dependent oxidoreductase n=1 Tax=Nocardia pulmonis TaxID=2951408 RepID=A0A9X2IWK4_9NOCA|nr:MULTISPECIES: nitroreductase family deazaflavin-dependent oxidoreductase [Nocardia]MCM6773649.1 nitroreductase family deazaflavin-dependent oxidoreductase [Nocardia pulmonis]MCM6786536.1 nitroreductase family deazaflavin-dependent oxidoreductase [Nocardia sp. CDC159]
MSIMARLVAASTRFTTRGVYLGRRSSKVHVALYRRTNGKVGGRLPGWPGARILLLDHVGARSGVRRTSPVIYLDYGDSVVVAASKAGQPTHPAWYFNLRAHPDTTIRIGSEVRPVRARIADGAEREQLWTRLVDAFPGYAFYQKSAGRRRIPIVVLEPR